MEVQVVGDGLSITVGKQQHNRSIRALCVDELHLPVNFVNELAHQKAIYIQGRPALLDETVPSGSRIRLEGGVEVPYGLTPELGEKAFTLDVLYEDEHLLVVNKPAGIIIYPGDEASEDVTLGHLIAGYYALQGTLRKVMHVHRLDRDTTGAILYAKHTYSLRAMDEQLAAHGIHRTYFALVRGRLPAENGTIRAAIGRDRHVSGRYRVSETGKPAVTHYRVLAASEVANDAVSLVECRLETGRTHQIRVHMSHFGCPVVGDTIYGAPRGIGSLAWQSGLALHARELSFVHPYLNESVGVTASLPDTFQSAIIRLGWDARLDQQ